MIAGRCFIKLEMKFKSSLLCRVDFTLQNWSTQIILSVGTFFSDRFILYLRVTNTLIYNQARHIQAKFSRRLSVAQQRHTFYMERLREKSARWNSGAEAGVHSVISSHRYKYMKAGRFRRSISGCRTLHYGTHSLVILRGFAKHLFLIS